MNKVLVEVAGIAQSESTNAYALILKEVNGERRLPIIIGAFEAQAIALQLEGVRAPRPMTHDLLKNVIEALDSNLVEVCIHDLRDGTFYAYLLLDDGHVEVDARPSDAIALALRCGAPIYVSEEVNGGSRPPPARRRGGRGGGRGGLLRPAPAFGCGTAFEPESNSQLCIASTGEGPTTAAASAAVAESH
jgi:bifunctional DNase/RNase